MRKLKSILACLIVVATCFVFASCSKKVEDLSFEQKYVVMEVGETLDVALSVKPQDLLNEVSISSSDTNVVEAMTIYSSNVDKLVGGLPETLKEHEGMFAIRLEALETEINGKDLYMRTYVISDNNETSYGKVYKYPANGGTPSAVNTVTDSE